MKEKNKKNKKLGLLIPLLYIVIGAVVIFGFEMYVKDNINMVDVIVAKNDIDFKEEFTIDNLEIRATNAKYVVSQAYQNVTEADLEVLYGQLAAVKINKGAQIYSGLIDQFDLVPDTSKGEFIAPIPNDWILAVPGSLRKSYYADLYVIAPEKQKSVTNQLTELNALNGIVELTEEEASQPFYETPILTKVKVSSTKDRANNEVRSVNEDATGSISDLEILTTNDQLTTIRQYIDEGYKLYVTYTFHSKGE